MGKYTRSDYYHNAPSRFNETYEVIHELKQKIKTVLNRQEKTETVLPLYEDPDELWIKSEWKRTDSYNRLCTAYYEVIVSYVLGNIDDSQVVLNRLLEVLYETARSVPDLMDRQKYMCLVNATCRSETGKFASDCVNKIKDEYMRFPLRLHSNFKNDKTSIIIWGNEDSDLYKALNADKTLSHAAVLNSTERFVMLRVSQPFEHSYVESVTSQKNNSIDELTSKIETIKETNGDKPEHDNFERVAIDNNQTHPLMPSTAGFITDSLTDEPYNGKIEDNVVQDNELINLQEIDIEKKQSEKSFTESDTAIHELMPDIFFRDGSDWDKGE
jgi:hypothetical protein